MTIASQDRTRSKGGVLPLTLLFLFFAAFITIDVGLAIVAVRTSPGEIEEHPYIRGLHFNQTLAERRAQEALGWRAGAALQDTPHGAVVEVVMEDHAGARLAGLSISGTLHRPASAREDRAVSFATAGDGVYKASVDGLQPGGWRFVGQARDRAGHVLDFERSFTWRMARP